MQKIFRILVIIAMLITAYLLVLAWNRDYGGSAAVNPQATIASNSDMVNVIGDLPASATLTSNESQTQLIDVQTDLYSIQIDPMGGDVIYAALKGYNATLDSDTPFVMLENQNRTYVAQSLLSGVDSVDSRAVYSSEQTSYQMVGDSLLVPLSYYKDGLKVTKTYEFTKGAYPIKLRHNINNTSGTNWAGSLYIQLKRDNSKDPGLADKGALGMATYLGGAWGVPSEPYNKLKFGDFNDNEISKNSKDGWVAILQHYFVSAWTPAGYEHTPKFFSRTTGTDNYIGYQSDITVADGRQITLEDVLYVGPKVQNDLAPVAVGLERTVDYGVFWPISKPIFMLLQAIQSVLGNWGWSIIALTLVIKTMLLWISGKSYYSMAKMRMIAPRLQKLKDEFGDDRMKMSQEMMRIYKEEQVNPMAGCLPVLLQMPIFLGLYWCLVESVELRHAPWILWIRDLSAMDPWFILPIIMGATMYFQYLLNPQPTDPMQAKIMRFLPIIFTVFMLFFPAGLVLYWTVNNLFGMVQQQIINKKVEKEFKNRTVKTLDG